jgi:hypothetical protein
VECIQSKPVQPLGSARVNGSTAALGNGSCGDGICPPIPAGGWAIIPAQARGRFGNEPSTNRYRTPS